MPSKNSSSIAVGMTLLADNIAAAFASLWPWSAASLEARRLAADGHPRGAVADVFYLISFDDTAPDSALSAIRAAGFAVREPGPQRGFVTVRIRIPLAAFDLTIAGARLDHIVEEHHGFATLIGASRLPSDEVTRAGQGKTHRIAAI